MKILVSACRVIVGTLFIISGMIKANDPVGFSYKMEEYFTVFKITDSIADTVYTIRDLNLEEKQALISGNSSIQPTDYEGKPYKLDSTTTENDFIYTRESSVQMRAVEAKNWFNSFCDFMHDQALALSILICVLEILLGVAVLAGVYMELSSFLLLAMIVFFTFLTFYSAYYNKVTDCGCFGDALKLKPWESFIKDVVLLVLIIPIFIQRKRIDGRNWDTIEKTITIASIVLGFLLSVVVFDWYLPAVFILLFLGARILLNKILKNFNIAKFSLTLLTAFLSTGFTTYCYLHLPVKDYRPWKPGNVIPEKMISSPEWANVYMVYKNKNTGEVKEYLSVKVDEKGNKTNDFSWMTEEFINENEFVNQRKDVVKPYEEAPIHDFTLDDYDSGEPYAKDFIYKPGYKFMLVAYDLKKTNLTVQPRINELALQSEKNNIEFIGATSSRNMVEKFRHDHQNPFKYYINDATSLKTIIRSNPGLVLIKDTVVVDMWHYNDLPTWDNVSAKYFK